MPLSPSALAELRAELLGLEVERQNIDAKIAAINTMLATYGSRSSSLPTADRPPTPAGSGINTGFRDKVREMLRDRERSAAEVIKGLRDGGVQASGQTPLETRVYNELNRMKKTGAVVRNEMTKRYRLA